MKTEPYTHQAAEYEASCDSVSRALLWQMRTGKTKVVIDTSFHLRDEGKIAGALVLAPNGVHANWARRELPRHAWDDGYDALAWRSSKSGMDEEAAQFVRSSDFPVLAVNNEALQLKRVQAVIRLLLRRGMILFAADESHDFRRPGARRTRLARTLAKRCAYRRILTGTAVLNDPLHAFSQFELLQPGALGFTRFDEFKGHFATCVMHKTRSGRQFPEWKPRRLEELRERMARWSSVVLREDCGDMPELVETERLIPLSEAQAKAYLQMVEEWTLDLDSVSSVTPKEGGVRMLKLQQILGGFVYDDDGEVHSIDDNPPRLDAMWEQVEGTLPGKSIVWCRFREDIRRVCARLDAEGVGYVRYHGGMTQRRKDEAEDRFREDDSVSTVVGQRRSGGQGLDFSAADVIVNYSHEHDAIITEQAKERATKIGGKHVGLVDFRAHGTVDDTVLEALSDKRDVSDYLAGAGLKHRLLEILGETDV